MGQGVPVSPTAPSDGQALCYDAASTSYKPAACTNAGPAGSQQYVACRKDRDVERSNAVTRADKKQRDLGEWMLNHPN